MTDSAAEQPALSAYLRNAAETLAAAHLPSPLREAEFLLLHALGITRSERIMQANRILTPAEIRRCDAYIRRRAAREPAAYITGEKGFYNHVFRVTPDTLIPRPDSECLIEAARERFAERAGESLRILDICTGGGCLLVSAVHLFPRATGTGTDICAAALRVAARNARDTGAAPRTRFIQADGVNGLQGNFDIIFCNPPYIPEGAKATLQTEVSGYEPAQALFSGTDGFDLYRTLLPAFPRLLAKNGAAFCECGDDQTEALSALGAAAGLRTENVLYDLAPSPRGVVFNK